MRRRDLLKSTLATGALAAPRIARAEKSRVIRFVPVAGVSILDPVWTPARPTRDHGYMVFDTLYGIDENLGSICVNYWYHPTPTALRSQSAG